MKKGLLVVILLALLASIGGGVAYLTFSYKPTFISPLATGEILSTATSSLLPDSTVIGFLPYWNLAKEPTVDFSVLDQVIYFGLAVDRDGNIVKREGDNQELGWYWFNSDNLAEIKTLAHQKGKKILFSINCFDNDTIDRILSDNQIQNRLVYNVMDLIQANDFDGLNVDFEYTFDTSGKYPQKDQYTFFIEKLSKKLKSVNKNYILSADFYSNVVIHGNIYDIVPIGNVLDNFIIMAYDYYRASSSTSGPVAPLKSDQSRSITEALQAAFTKVPKEKIILGIPLYGYEWQTYSDKPGSWTVPQTGMAASYKYVHQLIEEKNLDIKWDKEAMSPYLVYKDSGQINQIYFENLASLSLKYQLVRQSQIGGVAFWAIGYEGEFQEVWQEAGQKLKNQ